MLFAVHRRAAITLLLAFALAYSAKATARDRGASIYQTETPIAAKPAAAGRPMLLAVGALAMVDEAARRHGVPVALARAVMRIESGGDCRARSRAGAIGAMQVLPATARAMGIAGPLTVCGNSIEAGVRYLARIIAAHGMDCGALSLYERGKAAQPACTAYGRRILQFARP